jgi:hypothetical protein
MLVVVSSTLVLWFCVSMVCQAWPKLLEKVRRRDVICLVPRWNFFAPIPGTEDLLLLYRGRENGGKPSNWIDISRKGGNRWTRCFWNPQRRQNKAMFDACQQLARGSEEIRSAAGIPSAIKTSVPYILLLNYVSSVDALPNDEYRQFTVMRSTGKDKSHEPRAIFVSDFHKLEATSR